MIGRFCEVKLVLCADRYLVHTQTITSNKSVRSKRGNREPQGIDPRREPVCGCVHTRHTQDTAWLCSTWCCVRGQRERRCASAAREREDVRQRPEREKMCVSGQTLANWRTPHFADYIIRLRSFENGELAQPPLCGFYYKTQTRKMGVARSFENGELAQPPLCGFYL